MSVEIIAVIHNYTIPFSLILLLFNDKFDSIHLYKERQYKRIFFKY